MKPLVISFSKDFSVKAGQSLVILSRDRYGICDTELWEWTNGGAKKSAPVPEPPVEQEKIDEAAEAVQITQAQIRRANGRNPAAQESLAGVATPELEQDLLDLCVELGRPIVMSNVVKYLYPKENNSINARRKASAVMAACLRHGLLINVPVSEEIRRQAKVPGVKIKKMYYIPATPFSD